MKLLLLIIGLLAGFFYTKINAQPTNDECNNATSISNTASCVPVSGTIINATASPQANTCTGNANDDVWFSFTATTDIINLELSNFSNSATDMAFSVFSGTCGSLGVPILCSDPNSGVASGLIPGQTYYIRTWSVSASPQSNNFDICGTAMTTICGSPATPNNQDYCYAPALLTAGGGNFSSETSGQYTNDSPGNLGGLFCGSIENNSWYAFVQGSGTAATFDFTVSNCSDGVQAEVYDVTTDANGCCTNFTSMSNCWNPGVAEAGAVTAEGLIPGHTYYLMVDGQAGDICDFTVANWSATGILAIQLTSFSGVAMPYENQLRWTTQSETESDYFEVQRSFDGDHFVSLGIVKGAGTSNNSHHYSFTDKHVRFGEVYYRLKQVDFDGKEQFSNPIQLARTIQNSGLISVYPNPADNQLIVEFNNEKKLSKQKASVQLISLEGKMIRSQQLQEGGFHRLYFDLTGIEKGMYFVRTITSEKQLSQKPFIKR